MPPVEDGGGMPVPVPQNPEDVEDNVETADDELDQMPVDEDDGELPVPVRPHDEDAAVGETLVDKDTLPVPGR